MRSFENPEVIKIFMNGMVKLNIMIVCYILRLVFIACVIVYIIYFLAETAPKFNCKLNIKNLKQYLRKRRQEIKGTFTKEKIKELSKKRFLKIKPYVWKCRYLIIWQILLQLSWYFVSLCFRFINKVKVIPDWNNICSEQELSLLWTRSLYTFLFFIIAPMFITFCFWNKFVRNIWILIYILWIIFCFLWLFLDLSCYNITPLF